MPTSTWEERQCQPRYDDGDDGVPSQDVACRLSEAQSHKLRQRVNLGSEVARGKDESQQGNKHKGIPGVVAGHNARGESCRRRGNEHRRADVGAPHGETDVVPPQRTFGQKQGTALLAFRTGPYANGDEYGEIDSQDEPVKALHVVTFHSFLGVIPLCRYTVISLYRYSVELFCYFNRDRV